MIALKLTVNFRHKTTAHKMKILIAEDNLVNQMVLGKILKKNGHDTAVAENGTEAVQMALADDFALILMDLQMPDKDGIEATREIREVKPDSPVIIALTAATMGEERELCLEVGMNDFLSKPISKEQIDQMLSKWF